MQILKNTFNKDTVNIMVDIETLGTSPGCQVLSIGLAFFNEEGVITSDEFYPLLSEQCGEVDKRTLEWWGSQSDASKLVFANNILHGIHIGECAAKITEFIGQAKKYNGLEPGAKCQVNMWGNGASFDLSILQRLFLDHGIDVPWNTFGDRCYRTAMKLLGPVITPRPGVHHNAKDDACYQAVCLVKAIKNADKP